MAQAFIAFPPQYAVQRMGINALARTMLPVLQLMLPQRLQQQRDATAYLMDLMQRLDLSEMRVTTDFEVILPDVVRSSEVIMRARAPEMAVLLPGRQSGFLGAQTVM